MFRILLVRLKIKPVIGLLFFCGILFGSQSIALAWDDKFFPTNYSSDKQLNLTVGQTQYVQNSQVDVLAYFTNNTSDKSLVISSYDFCPDSSGMDAAYSDSRLYDSGWADNGKKWDTAVTEFSFKTGSTEHASYKNKSRKAGQCNKHDGNSNTNTITIKKEWLARDENVDRYYVRIIADHVDMYSKKWDGVIDGFRFNLNGSGVDSIAPRGSGAENGVYGAQGSGYQNTVIRDNNDGANNTSYQVPFGSSCSVKSNSAARMNFYDLDNGGGGGAQDNGKISARLYSRDYGSSTDKEVVFTKKSSGDFSDGSKKWTPSTKDNTTSWVQFTAQPNKRYRVVLNNVYYNNTIQFSMPFDSIYWQTQCQKFNVTPTTSFKANASNGTEKFGWAARTSTPVVQVGDKVYWRYSVQNTEPGIASFQRVSNSYQDYNPPTSSSWNVGTPSGNTVLQGLASQTYTLNGQTYLVEKQITSDMIGKNVCYRWGVNPSTNTDTDSAYSYGNSQGCVQVAGGSYELTPEVELNKAGVVSASSSIDVKGIVSNSGAISNDAQWSLSKIIVGPNGEITSEKQDNGNSPCIWFGSRCTVASFGTHKFIGETEIANLSNQEIPDEAIGTKVCWALSVKPPTPDPSATGTWRHSIPKCVVIGKKPKVQIKGSDARIRGLISTSVSNINIANVGNRVFGSWDEFGVMSSGDNSNFASGKGLATGSSEPVQSAWSGITFANTKAINDDGSQFGNFESFTNPAKIADYFENQGTETSTSNINLDSMGKGIYTTNRDVTISGSTNKSIIIVASGTVTIDGSGINYRTDSQDGKIRNLTDIPQVLIIAKNIRINESVSNIDSWLIAKESINTCADRVSNVNSPNLSSEMCSQPLLINGPVATKSLYLFRTAGSGPSTAIRDPAEIFNLRPDSYLWAYNYGLSLNHPKTASIVELPPRY